LEGCVRARVCACCACYAPTLPTRANLCQHVTPRSLNTQKKTIARRYGLHAANGNASAGTFGARSLVAGARHPIRIRMYDHTSAQVVQLYWRAASGGAWTPVPFSAFWAVPVDPPTYASVRTLGYPEPRAIVAPTAPAPPPHRDDAAGRGAGLARAPAHRPRLYLVLGGDGESEAAAAAAAGVAANSPNTSARFLFGCLPNSLLSRALTPNMFSPLFVPQSFFRTRRRKATPRSTTRSPPSLSRSPTLACPSSTRLRWSTTVRARTHARACTRRESCRALRQCCLLRCGAVRGRHAHHHNACSLTHVCTHSPPNPNKKT
jgi:hypothetical protein